MEVLFKMNEKVVELPKYNGIWEITMDVPIGTHEYKFTMGSWGDAEVLLNAGACTIQYAGYGNAKIAAARFYNRPLTATEILQNYNVQKTRFGL